MTRNFIFFSQIWDQILKEWSFSCFKKVQVVRAQKLGNTNCLCEKGTNSRGKSLRTWRTWFWAFWNRSVRPSIYYIRKKKLLPLSLYVLEHNRKCTRKHEIDCPCHVIENLILFLTYLSNLPDKLNDTSLNNLPDKMTNTLLYDLKGFFRSTYECFQSNNFDYG